MSDTSRFFEDTTNSSITVTTKLENPDQIDLQSDFIRTSTTLNSSSIIQDSSPTPSSPVRNESQILPVQSLFVPNDDSDEENIESDEQYTLFESQIQAIIPDICPSDIQKLHSEFGSSDNPVLRAVNSFYEGNSSTASVPIPNRSTQALYIRNESIQSSSAFQTRKRSRPSVLSMMNKKRFPFSEIQSSDPILSDVPTQRIKRKLSPTRVQRKELSPSLKWRRFIGGIQVISWATRPTMKAIPYGTPLTIEKSNSTTGAPRRGRHGVTTSVSSYLKLVQDSDIPSKRKEVGRLPESIAEILFPLVDQNVCDFDSTCILCDGRLSTGDSFIIQLDCFLTSKIFENTKESEVSFDDGLKQMRQSQSFSRSAYETESEQQQHRKRVALLNLFNKLGFNVENDKTKEEKLDEVIDLEDEVQLSQLGSPQNKEPQEFNDEMNLNQLKEFYKRTQTEKVLATLPETETKENFKLELRSYQKQGLTWMLRSEREIENTDNANLMNPLWKEFKWPKDISWNVMRDETLRENFESKLFYGNLYAGEYSLDKPILKSVCRGGILADEMGLGKTISTLSLIHNATYDRNVSFEEAKKENYAFKTTLIIVPTSLLAQWQDEFKKANNDNSHFLVYYGSDTNIDLATTLLQNNAPLVVFTTYGTVQNEWSRIQTLGTQQDIGLFSVKFFRIVLDEGHNIRNRMAKTTKACYDLSASRKWLLTGTPIINRLDDLYSLVKFLELEPWSHISYWNTFVTTPFEKKNYNQALDVVQAILEPVLLRRTKNMRKNGKLLVELPPKKIVIEKIKFSPKERDLYNWFLARAESSVQASIKRGDILKKYTMILVHILRLRQICCHMDLIKGAGDEMDEDLSAKQITNEHLEIPPELLMKSQTFTVEELNETKKSILEKFPSLEDLECSICTTQPIIFENIAFTECGHPFCLSCILEHLNYQELLHNPTLCPNCRHDISSSKLLLPKHLVDGSSSYTLSRYDSSLRSSKLNALLSHLRIIRDTTRNEKVVVFSQFSTYLDIMEREILLENDLTVFKFHGRMSMEKRSEILKEFKKPRNGTTVLLLSLKAGGVGLNLTEASRAFMCDPWWAPGTEDQAIDRIHRIGQENPVTVTRFIMEGSIEEKMLKIQERKRTIGEAVEVEEEERRRKRVEEIKTLFEAT